GGVFIASHRTESGGARTLPWNDTLGAEFLGGLSGIVLGVLALLGIAPMTLLSISVLVFGATFLLSSWTGFVSGSQSMFGLAGLFRGLLAICGVYPLPMVLVGFTCLGASALFSGAAIGSRLTVAHRG